ncbi:SPASM domain-containing protein [Xenorhabdus yunnanensis]|uniref:SPASM domain-containing protein n=1 Tax=Xenorhabdus yunnanensis TaxID=3025878 RepID=UPI00359C776D
MSQCGNTTFSVDPIGDVYLCASFSTQPDMKYGNLQNNSILELMTGTRATLYRIAVWPKRAGMQLPDGSVPDSPPGKTGL